MREFYHIQYNTNQGRYTHDVEMEFISSHLGCHKIGTTILDISGGGGRISFTLRKQGFRVVTTDINLKSLMHIKDTEPEIQTVLICAESQYLPFRKETFDAALCIQVPALVENSQDFFINVYSCLKPNGILMVTIHNRLSYRYLLHVLSLKIKRIKETIPVYSFTMGQILKRARAAGFKIHSTQGYNWIPFKKSSNAPLIPVFSTLEKLLCLRKLTWISPWVIVCMVKPAENLNFIDSGN